MTWLRAAVWVFAAYPWVLVGSLHLSWTSACLILGRRPSYGDHLDGPGTWVYFSGGVAGLCLMGLPLALIAGLVLIFAEGVMMMERPAPGRSAAVVRIILIPLLLSLGAFLVLAFDPGGAFDWLKD